MVAKDGDRPDNLASPMYQIWGLMAVITIATGIGIYLVGEANPLISIETEFAGVIISVIGVLLGLDSVAKYRRK